MTKDVKLKEKKKREPFVHITKRASLPLSIAILVRVIAIFAALLFCGVFTMIVTGYNPIEVYVTIFEGAFGSSRLWRTLFEIAILLAVALALTPAFKMRFWNIGGEGQILVGAIATTICMLYIGNRLPTWALILTMLVSALLAGAIWGLLPALFKALFGTNETLFTLMMNYVAMRLIVFFLGVADPQHGDITPLDLVYGRFPELFHRHFLSIVAIVLLTVAMYVYLKYTKHGYEISVVGESENTARYIGINVKKVILRTMALSGALCGFVGFLLVGGSDFGLRETTADGRGFTAIIVSWMAKFNPFMMFLTSGLVVFMSRGAEKIAEKMDVEPVFADVLTGIILFFIIGCEFFAQYRVHFNHKKKDVDSDEKEVA